MKIYIIITALICALLILLPLTLTGLYNGTNEKTTVTTEVTVNNEKILF